MEVLQDLSQALSVAAQALGQAVQDPAVQQAVGGLGQIAAALQPLQAVPQQQAAMQAALQAVAQQQAAMQAALQGVPQQLAGVQAQLGGLQGGLDVLAAKQGNQPARAHNAAMLDGYELQPLGKEDTGGQHALGTLPPAGVPFPATRDHLAELTHAQLDTLADFYGRGFAGANIAARRRAFKSFIGILNKS